MGPQQLAPTGGQNLIFCRFLLLGPILEVIGNQRMVVLVVDGGQLDPVGGRVSGSIAGSAASIFPRYRPPNTP